MKNCKLPHHMWAGLLLVVALAACSDDFLEYGDTGPDGLRFDLRAGIAQESETRADESGFAGGDRIGVFVVNHSAGAPGTLTLSENQANNMAFTLDAESGKWSAMSDIYWLDDKTPADVYGYYPYDNGLDRVEGYSFEVARDQSVNPEGEMGNYEASDFLWAKQSAATPGDRVNLMFNHRMAGVKVVLQEGSGFSGDEWTKLKKLVTVNNTIRTAEIDLATGTITATGNPDKHIVMNPESSGWRAVTVPQTVGAGKSVIGITINGTAYNYTPEGGMKFSSGKLHTFTLKVDKKGEGSGYAVTLTGQDITDWVADESSHDFNSFTYFVVECPEAGKLRECIAATGSDAATITNLKVIGQLTIEDFDFIRNDMHRITSLNLKETRVVRGVKEFNVETQTEYTIDDMLPSGGLSDISTLRRLILPECLKHTGRSSMSGLNLNSTLVIPESVTTLGYFSLQHMGEDCTVILPSKYEKVEACFLWESRCHVELKMPSTLKVIDGSGFARAYGLTGHFSLPPNLESMGPDAFYDCAHDLTGDIVIPEKIKEIPESAFNGLRFRNGTNVIIPSCVRKIGDGAFAGLTINNDLIFDKNLTYIASRAFQFANFKGRVKLHDNIQYLGSQVFGGSNLSGELEYPANLDYVIGGEGNNSGAFVGTSISSVKIGDNVTQIGSCAFEGCAFLRKVTIGKNLDIIDGTAFLGCGELTTFVCLAKEPPTVIGDNNPFEGIYLDKCVLEVPEASVDAYRHAKGWSRFRTITAHHELSFNVPELTCLDKGMTREGIIRAEGAWTVSECPSWVHVSPSKGTGKDNLTVTIDDASASREGRIVFRLDDSGYTTYADVRQLVYSEAKEDTEIILQRASAGVTPIPIFIVGEDFNADDIVSGKYLETMRNTMEQFFAIEPYRSYRNYFTVSTAVACSHATETDIPGMENCFNTEDLCPDYSKLKKYAVKVSANVAAAPSRALIILVNNRDMFGGRGEIADDGTCWASISMSGDTYPYDQRGLVQHYAGGAAFAGLGNESVTHFEHIQSCACPGCNDLGTFRSMKARGYYTNLTLSRRMDEAPWKDFIFHPRYSLMVDMWEGGAKHLRGVWRSEANSVMNTFIAYYNTISRYTIYRQIMKRAGKTPTLEDFIQHDIIDIP